MAQLPGALAHPQQQGATTVHWLVMLRPPVSGPDRLAHDG